MVAYMYVTQSAFTTTTSPSIPIHLWYKWLGQGLSFHYIPHLMEFHPWCFSVRKSFLPQPWQNMKLSYLHDYSLWWQQIDIGQDESISGCNEVSAVFYVVFNVWVEFLKSQKCEWLNHTVLCMHICNNLSAGLVKYAWSISGCYSTVNKHERKEVWTRVYSPLKKSPKSYPPYCKWFWSM